MNIIKLGCMEFRTDRRALHAVNNYCNVPTDMNQDRREMRETIELWLTTVPGGEIWNAVYNSSRYCVGGSVNNTDGTLYNVYFTESNNYAYPADVNPWD